MVKNQRGAYAVSPYKHVMVNGRKRSWITFSNESAAVNFIKERKLKHALLYKKR